MVNPKKEPKVPNWVIIKVFRSGPVCTDSKKNMLIYLRVIILNLTIYIIYLALSISTITPVVRVEEKVSNRLKSLCKSTFLKSLATVIQQRCFPVQGWYLVTASVLMYKNLCCQDFTVYRIVWNSVWYPDAVWRCKRICQCQRLSVRQIRQISLTPGVFCSIIRSHLSSL